MQRSLYKGPYIAYHLLKKIINSNNKKKQIIKTYSRASLIIPIMIGHTISIYNGHKFISIYITDLMIGHKLGEFIPTRTFTSHKKSEHKIKK